MDVFKNMQIRYSYRGDFTSEKLSKEQIETILKAGISAPSGYNNQTTFYLAIQNEKLIKELGKIYKTNGTATAPFVLVVLSEDKKKLTTNFEKENYGAAVENILLAVTALGLGTVWTDGDTRVPETNERLRKLLNVDKNITIKAVLPIGFPKNLGKAKTKPKIEDMVKFI